MFKKKKTPKQTNKQKPVSVPVPPPSPRWGAWPVRSLIAWGVGVLLIKGQGVQCLHSFHPEIIWCQVRMGCDLWNEECFIRSSTGWGF